MEEVKREKNVEEMEKVKKGKAEGDGEYEEGGEQLAYKNNRRRVERQVGKG
jgi:hypothetical protein